MNIQYFKIVALSLALISANTWADLADVKNKGVLSVSLYKDFPPYSYVKDGKQQIGRAHV